MTSSRPARRAAAAICSVHPGFAVATMREHPLLLLALIPVVLAAVALFAAITIASVALAAVLFVLGRRRNLYVGPRGMCGWRYGVRPYSHSGRREPGHWGYRA